MQESLFIESLNKNVLTYYCEFYNSLPFYISWRDLDSNLILANEKEAAAIGLESATTLINKPRAYNAISVYDDNLIRQFRESDKKVLQTHAQARYINFLQFADMSWNLLIGMKFPVFNHLNQLVAIAAFKIDIGDSTLSILNFDQCETEMIHKKIQNYHQFHYCIEEQTDNSMLSKRQKQCLFYLLRGQSARQIGEKLCISKRTVETHIEFILSKMQCNSRAELIDKALKSGLLNTLKENLV